MYVKIISTLYSSKGTNIDTSVTSESSIDPIKKDIEKWARTARRALEKHKKIGDNLHERDAVHDRCLEMINQASHKLKELFKSIETSVRQLNNIKDLMRTTKGEYLFEDCDEAKRLFGRQPKESIREFMALECDHISLYYKEQKVLHSALKSFIIELENILITRLNMYDITSLNYKEIKKLSKEKWLELLTQASHTRGKTLEAWVKDQLQGVYDEKSIIGDWCTVQRAKCQSLIDEIEREIKSYIRNKIIHNYIARIYLDDRIVTNILPRQHTQEMANNDTTYTNQAILSDDIESTQSRPDTHVLLPLLELCVTEVKTIPKLKELYTKPTDLEKLEREINNAQYMRDFYRQELHRSIDEQYQYIVRYFGNIISQIKNITHQESCKVTQSHSYQRAIFAKQEQIAQLLNTQLKRIDVRQGAFAMNDIEYLYTSISLEIDRALYVNERLLDFIKIRQMRHSEISTEEYNITINTITSTLKHIDNWKQYHSNLYADLTKYDSELNRSKIALDRGRAMYDPDMNAHVQNQEKTIRSIQECLHNLQKQVTEPNNASQELLESKIKTTQITIRAKYKKYIDTLSDLQHTDAKFRIWQPIIMKLHYPSIRMSDIEWTNNYNKMHDIKEVIKSEPDMSKLNVKTGGKQRKAGTQYQLIKERCDEIKCLITNITILDEQEQKYYDKA